MSKVPNRSHGTALTREAFERSRTALQLEYLDLYLIHWPAPFRGLYRQTWATLCELRGEGLVRSIGVSNFLPHHLSGIIEATGVVPAVNQVELHPYFSQPRLREYNVSLSITTQAWSPLGQAGDLLRDPLVCGLAVKYGKRPGAGGPALAPSAWTVPLPKSGRPERVRENLAITDFELEPADIRLMASLETGRRIGPDPETFDP